MKKTKIFSLSLTAFVLTMALCFSVYAAGNFTKTKTYAEGTFTDISTEAWYYKEVISAYELGFMNGMSTNNFGADGNVTVAQGITLASRIHSIYNGGNGEFTQGDVWYQTYVDYALKNGFVKENQFDSYTRNIKRSEMTTLFADALPAEYFAAINNVTKIPDVSSNETYATKLLILYNAGIVMGNDQFGTFYPNNDIKRSEVSAIINRVAIPENRLKKTLSEKTFGNPVYLIDDKNINLGSRGLASGWNYDNRFQIMNTADSVSTTINDGNGEMFVNLNRSFKERTSGTLTFDLLFSIKKTGDGNYFKFTNQNGEDSFVLSTGGGFYKVGETVLPVAYGYLKEASKLNIRMDLDANIAEVIIDGVNCGTFPMNEFPISKVEMGVTKEGTGTFSPLWVRLYANYLVNEVFLTTPISILPQDWQINGNMVIDKKDGVGQIDAYSMKISGVAGTPSVAKKSFSAVDGTVIYETYVLLQKGQSGAFVSLNSGDVEGIKVVTDGNTFKTGKGETLRAYTDNIWQCVRIEANTATGKAFIRIDGKDVGTHDFDNKVESFDNITVGFNPQSNADMWFDDVKVAKYEEPSDYCPVPVPAESKDYYVGLNVCSLWRNGHHYGWDYISSFPDIEPVLGYYDEGIIELADWEIKFMVEHGIDYQHLCWYSSSGNVQDPIKKTRMNDALHDGIFNAKYSNMIKFNFMWENSGIDVRSLDQFKEYIWSYWKEYYFTDSRFMTMDNKIVFTVWSYGNFLKAFGGTPEGAKEAIEWMNQDCKDMGFDGLILLFADGHQMQKPYFDGVAAIGAQGTYGYHWNQTGKDADHQIYRMSTQQEFNSVHIVPTISVGFNNIGWSSVRKDLISLDGHAKVADYIKNTHLKKYDQNTWEGKALMVSTWNEYGEGTYVMPASVHGFGYLDTIRKYFTDAPAEHEDAIPTANQKDRLGYLYYNDRSLIRPWDYEREEEKIPSQVVLGWDMSKADNFAEWKDMFGVVDVANKDGAFVGKMEKDDGGIINAKPLNFDSTNAQFLHIRMKTTSPSRIEVFFKTDKDDKWTQTKSIGVNSEKKDEYVDYYLNLKSCPTWSDKITTLRIDPISKPGTFEISNIEFLAASIEEKPIKLLINTKEIKYNFNPEDDGEELYVACNPSSGIFSMQNLYYEFSRFSGKLYLANRDTEFRFTIGSDKAIVNGKEVTLKKAVTLRDGLPILPIVYMANTMGYKVERTAEAISIASIEQKYIDAIANRVPYEYEFEIPNDLEGWGTQNSIVSVLDGVASGTSTEQSSQDNPSFDPALSSPKLKIDAKKYTKIAVRMRHKFEGAEDSLRIYFKTEKDSALSEDKAEGIKLQGTDTGDEFVEYILDMSKNPAWTGTVTGIRFDPHNRNGSFDVDYIKFVIDPNYTATEEAKADPNAKISIVNGDASAEEVAFFSNNADISIIEDPKKAGNKCYQVISKLPGKNWTYFRQNVTFKANTTYLVEFDAMVIGTNDGSKDTESTQIQLNLRYKDENDKVDHVSGFVECGSKDGWKHFSKEVTVGMSDFRDEDQFAIYANPIGDLSVSYLIDNVKVTEKE